MHKVVTISNGKIVIEVPLQGGSPWFGYIWIDDVCHIITKKKRSVTIKKIIILNK